MRVLHLPYNIASQISVTVRALRNIGIDARGIVLNNSSIQNTDGIESFQCVSYRENLVKSILQTFWWWTRVIPALRWADVVHWHFNGRAMPLNFDLNYIEFLDKARIVEFWGSDIRIPEIASSDNPYRAKMYQEYPEIARGASNRSLKTQRRFAKYGFNCLLPGLEVEPYIKREIFPRPYRTRARLIISDFRHRYPDPGKLRPVIAHAPSNKAKKGTEKILQSINELKTKHDFEFKIIHGTPHAEALAMLKGCDIMLDQFISGSFGVAALEAMAFGKPVLCYIKPSLSKQYSPDLPIINTNLDNLKEVLEDLLKNGEKRHKIGRLSRAYVEKHHDAYKIARDLVGIYEELIRRTRNKKK